MQRSLIGLGLLAVGLSVGLAAPARADDPIITNFWWHINEIYEQEAARDQTRNSHVTLRFPPPRTFPFDAFGHLSTEELLRACREGIVEARRRDGDTPEGDRQVAENVHRCLEYYPLLSKRERDWELLMRLIRDARTDAVFREYLILRSVPGLAPPSLFGAYFADASLARRQDLVESLAGVATAPSQLTALQLAAIDAAFTAYDESYRRALAADSALAEDMDSESAALEPAYHKERPDLPLTEETEETLRGIRAQLRAAIDQFAPLLDPSRPAPDRVRARLRERIGAAIANYDLPNAEAVLALLESN